MIVFLLEEQSMKEVLDVLLPQILPRDVSFKTIPHEGKRDLKSSISRKLRAWNAPNTKFVVVHDQDNADCVELKKSLLEIAKPANRDVLVRIACRELEAWYFGDLNALSKAYKKDFSSLANKKKFRIPDRIADPKRELLRLFPKHQQIEGARRISRHMSIDRNTSQSFRCFVDGVRRFAAG